MACADQTEISPNKWTTFGGTPCFQLVRMEITILFVENFHFYFVVFLRHHCAIRYIF